MKGIWGGSNGNGDDDQPPGSAHDVGVEDDTPDEHTRLLPNRVVSNNNYLSPDDPAVLDPPSHSRRVSC